MKNSTTAKLAAILLGTALAVSGCGGGGDGSASRMDPDERPAPTPRAVLEPGAGLHLSDAAPVYADAADRTILAAQEDGDTIPTQSAVVTRDFDADTTAVSTSGFSVKSIRSDGDGGFHVVFVDGDVETPVHFERGDLPQGETAYRIDEDNTSFALWLIGGDRFSEDDPTVRLPNHNFMGFVAGNASDGGAVRERFWFVLGARTPAAAQTMGQASYNGFFFADSWNAGNPSNGQRRHLDGHLRLVANFDLGRLEGYIRSVRGSQPGERARSHWPTSSFRITDGKFNDQGQFTATLTGHDSADDPDLGQSAAGYVGDLLGELYGPRAEEIGAVLTATRDAAGDAHDRVLQGYVRGQRVFNTRTDDTAFSTGVDRHDTNTPTPRIVSQGDGNRVTAVAPDGVGGYRITYLVDGQTRSVNFAPDDAPLGNTSASYTRRDGALQWYWRPWGGSKYSSAASWSHNRYADDEWEFGTWGYVVHGSRTPAAAMPTVGSATYRGEAYAQVWEPTPANASVRFSQSYSGSLNLTADFAAGSIAGRIDNLRRGTTFGSDSAPVSGEFTIGNGTIQGNALSADLSGSDLTNEVAFTGNVRGAFYGPAAEEAAGVMEATGDDNTLLHGRFIGRKQ